MSQEVLSVKKLTEEQSWLQTGALLVLAVVAFAFSLHYARAVLIPFTLALFLNYLVAPIVDFQMIRMRLNRVTSVTMTLLIVVLVLAMMVFLLLTVIQDATAVGTDPQFHAKLERKLEGPLNYAFLALDSFSIREEEPVDATTSASEPWQEDEDPPADDPSGEPLPEEEPPPNEEAESTDEPEVSDEPDADAITEDPPESPADLTDEEPGEIQSLPKPTISRTRQFLRWLRFQLQDEAPQLATQFSGTLLSMISTTVITAIFVGFMLAGRDPYKISKGIYAEIDKNVRRYIATKFFISVVTGLFVWVALELVGLRFASMFGLIAFCLNFIPSIGSIISTLLPIPFAIVEFDSALTIALAILLPGTVQMVLGNVVEPKIMGDGLQLHPVTILMGLTFFGLLWGPVGMLLAAPITASIRIVLMRFTTTEPIGKLMAGILPGAEEEIIGAANSGEAG